MQTKFLSKDECLANRAWLVMDAEGQTLGRFASKVASLLTGKHKACFAKHADTGDYVVVLNADKVKLTGRKLEQKKYYRHSGYVGGIKTDVAGELIKEKPEFLIWKTVKGMLPKTNLAKKQLTKLKVYRGSEHPHKAQNPIASEL